MKKALRTIFLFSLSLLLLVGCKGAKKVEQATSLYKDGKYKAVYDKFDDRGWKGYVEVEVKDGKIITVDFDYLNKDNKRKSEDKTYNEKMKAAVKTSPSEFSPQLEKDLIAKQDINKVDGVSGATTSTGDFKTLSTAALENAKNGDQKENIVPLK